MLTLGALVSSLRLKAYARAGPSVSERLAAVVRGLKPELVNNADKRVDLGDLSYLPERGFGRGIHSITGECHVLRHQAVGAGKSCLLYPP